MEHYDGTNALLEMDKLPVSKAVLKNILPTIGILLLTLIYNYADLFFIGMTGNDYAVSAVTLAFPIFMIFLAMGSDRHYGTELAYMDDTGKTGRFGDGALVLSRYGGMVLSGRVLLRIQSHDRL